VKGTAIMTEANRNLATVKSDSVAPQSGEATKPRAVLNETIRNVIKMSGTVKKRSWTDPTLQIWTSNSSMKFMQFIATAGPANGIYFSGAASANLGVDAATLTNLKNLPVGSNIELSYDPDVNTDLSTNCTALTYLNTTLLLNIIQFP
jgi:hypothetical protein